MKNLLKQVDFNKFSNLYSQFNPKVLAFSACDASGNVFWINDSSFEDSINLITREIYSNDDKHNEDIHHRTLDNNSKNFYYIIIKDLADRVCGGVAIVFKRDSNEEIENKNDQEFLKIITSLISNEREYISELNTMAYELEERYEELNLVYDTDDKSDGLVNGPEVLESLAKNCTDYLDVALAVLIMPKEDLTIFHHNTKHTIHYIHSILLQLKNNLYPWIEKNNISLVLNDLTDPQRESLIPDIPYKLACSPIILNNNETSGILVTINPNYAKDFSNSDRNLLETMARKAAKVTMANYDSLTGLLKRNGFEHLISESLKCAQTEGKKYSVLNIDIDDMKVVNDIADNKAGDQLIIDIGKLIRNKIRDTDSLARLSGDKYGVLLDSCSLEMACTIADNIRLAVHTMNYSYQGQPYDTSVCIGVSEINADSESIQAIFAASELAVNIAKEHGRNLVQVYQSGDTQLQRRRGEIYWVRGIQKSLNQDGFELYSQLIKPIDGAPNSLHFEILLRMKAKDNSIIPPGKFLPAAERFRLMTNIDTWVIENSFKSLSLAAHKFNVFDYIWTINLSGQSMNEPNLIDLIISLAKTYQIPSKSICFEVTETVAVNNLQDARHVLKTLKDLGFSFALDDFGSGLSSFAYLKNLPVDYLKIDGSFIKGIVDDPFTHEIVKAINQVSQIRGLETIAEFVENDDIIRCIKDIGVNFAQGYGVAKPIPLTEQLSGLEQDQLRFAS